MTKIIEGIKAQIRICEYSIELSQERVAKYRKDNDLEMVAYNEGCMWTNNSLIQNLKQLLEENTNV